MEETEGARMRRIDTRHMAALAILICLTALIGPTPGCAKPPPRDGSVRVTYTFENMRRFVDAEGNPISSRDEWALVEDLIEDLRIHYHQKRNRFGATFQTDRTVDPSARGDMLTATYTATLVVWDMEDVHRINQRVNALRGKRFGPSREAAQVDPYTASVSYRSGFLRADLRVVLTGHAEPGTVVYLYDSVLADPRRIVATQAGQWESAVNISEGQSHVYGYFVDPRTRMPVIFRVNIGTRIFAEIDRATADAEFGRDYPGRRFKLVAPPRDTPPAEKSPN